RLAFTWARKWYFYFNANDIYVLYSSSLSLLYNASSHTNPYQTGSDDCQYHLRVQIYFHRYAPYRILATIYLTTEVFKLVIDIPRRQGVSLRAWMTRLN